MDSGSISITNQRHFEVDAEKAFVIVVMGVIHVYEILSNIDFHTLPTGFFRIILEFLAGPLGRASGRAGIHVCHGHWNDFYAA